MQAKYILESTANDDTAYMCIDKRDNQSKYFCRSFFPKEYDYARGHIRYTLLYKEKVNVITQKKIVQYDKLTPMISSPYRALTVVYVAPVVPAVTHVRK